MFATALSYLDALPRTALALILVSVTCFIGMVNYLAGADATFSAIYLLPIGIAAWLLTPAVAYALAILSSLIRVSTDLGSGTQYVNALVPLWNAAARFVVLVAVLQLIIELRKLHRAVEARAEERAVKLTAAIAVREQLERELLHISEREQRRLGHDIHDSVCQHLTGTALAGQVLTETLKSKGSPQARDADHVVNLIEEAITLSRNLAKDLNSVRVSIDGLMEALEDFAASTGDLFKIKCRFDCEFPIVITDTETSEHLFRIAQEAVSNAIKHGRATNVLIRLEMQGTRKKLSVIDDGSGLPRSGLDENGMGLRIMSYRAKLIGAKFNIRRERNGTVVTCLLPEKRDEPANARVRHH